MKFEFLLDAFMNACNFFIEYEFWKCMFEWLKFDFLFFLFFEWCNYEIMKFLIKSEFWIWMKMHVWIHKIWFFLYCLKNAFMNAWKFDWIWISGLNENACLSAWNLIFFCFEECIYECLKLCEFFEWKCMLECINSFCLFDLVLLFFLKKRMHLWMRDILWISWIKMHAWIHEFFLSFWYCSFFFKNAWNFVNFLNESACLNTLILFVFLIFFQKRMHLWMRKTWFFLFYYFWRMHIWMHEIWFSFILLFLKNTYMNAWNSIFFCFVIFEKCIYECMKFDFLLFCYLWRMYIWMHEI